MLKRLTVSNLAVVERAEVEFDPALNVITGETGAGKSVLMGALELVLGGRAEASAVRDGAKEARIEAAFAVPGVVDAFLDAAGLPLLGVVPEDPDVPYCLNQGLVLRERNYYAARAYENIAKRIMGQKAPLMKI